jgi:tRNA(Arg) A34 adenosine deaminase TadA
MIDPTPEDFMRRAVLLSRQGMERNAGGPFGAVIVKDGRIVGEGHNRVTSTNDPTAHGEIVAIRDAAARLNTYSLEGAAIYTSCEPCPMCLAAIYWARLDRIYYGNTAADAAAIGFDDAEIYRQFTLLPQARAIAATDLLRDEAIAVFRDWQAKPDKAPY